MTRRGGWLAVALALLALALRAAAIPGLLASDAQRTGGAPELLLTDARTCLELRAVEVALAQRELLLVDRALFHPLGDIARDAPGLPGALALGLQLAGWRLGAANDGAASPLEWAALALPPLFGALAVLATLALARQFASESAALWAAALAALWAPGSFAGELDPGAPAALLALLSLVSFVWGARSRTDFDRVLGGLFSGGLAGLALFTSLSVWPVLGCGHAWLAFHAARARGTAARDLHREAVLHALACALVLLVPARSSPWNVLHPGTLRALSSAWLMLPLGIGAGHAVALFLFRRGIEERGFVRRALPLLGAFGLLAASEPLAPLRHGVIEPSPQALLPLFPLLMNWIVRTHWRALLVVAALGGSVALAPLRAGDEEANMLAALRSLRDATGDRGAWPAAGAAHPGGVFAPQRAALVPFHARRAVLPGAYPASALDTGLHRELRAALAASAMGGAGEERDAQLAAYGANHWLERDASGAWRVRRLPHPAPRPPSVSPPK